MGFCTRQGNAFLLRQWQRGGLCPSCSSAHRFSPHDCWQLSKKQGSGRLISVKGWTSYGQWGGTSNGVCLRVQ